MCVAPENPTPSNEEAEEQLLQLEAKTIPLLEVQIAELLKRNREGNLLDVADLSVVKQEIHKINTQLLQLKTTIASSGMPNLADQRRAVDVIVKINKQEKAMDSRVWSVHSLEMYGCVPSVVDDFVAMQPKHLQVLENIGTTLALNTWGYSANKRTQAVAVEKLQKIDLALGVVEKDFIGRKKQIEIQEKVYSEARDVGELNMDVVKLIVLRLHSELSQPSVLEIEKRLASLSLEVWKNAIPFIEMPVRRVFELMDGGFVAGLNFTQYKVLLNDWAAASSEFGAFLNAQDDPKKKIHLGGIAEEFQLKEASLADNIFDFWKTNVVQIIPGLDSTDDNSYAGYVLDLNNLITAGTLDSFDPQTANGWYESLRQRRRITEASSNSILEGLPPFSQPDQYVQFLQHNYWQPGIDIEDRLLGLINSHETKENLLSQYKAQRELFLRKLNYIEDRESGHEELRTRFSEIDEEILFELEKIARQIGDPKILADFAQARPHFVARKLLYYQWIALAETRTEERKPPHGVNADTFPFSGPQIYELIHGGMLDGDFGEVTNKVDANPTTYGVKSMVRTNAHSPQGEQLIFDDVEVHRTAVGDVMRIIDKIYRGKVVARTNGGEKIDPTKIQVFMPDLIGYLVKETGNSETTCRNALRLHWVSTLHQSYLLSKGSPQAKDEFFYLHHILEYLTKYADPKRRTDSFNTDLILSTFGAYGTTYVSKDDFEKLVLKLKEEGGDRTHANYFSDSEERKNRLGFKSFRFLLYPLFLLKNRWNQVEIQDINGYCVASPLDFFLDKNYPANYDPAIDPPPTPIRYPSSRPDRKGAVRTFSDIRSEQDEYLYEIMPFDKLSSGAYVEYFQKILTGPYSALKTLWKCKPEELVNLATSEGGMAVIKNIFFYLTPFLPYVGPEIIASTKGVADTVIRQLLLKVAVTVLMLKTDTSREKHWDEQQAEHTVDSWMREGHFTEEEVELLKKVVIGSRAWRIFFSGMSKSIEEQTTAANLFK